MPTYQYRCDKCQKGFEAFESIKSEPQRKCPSCGRRSLKRLIGAGAGILFYGTGFYHTDYEQKKKEKEPSSVSSQKDHKVE